MARYECFPGYSPQGDVERVCQEDGQWSGTQPICQGTNPLSEKIMALCVYVCVCGESILSR